MSVYCHHVRNNDFIIKLMLCSIGGKCSFAVVGLALVGLAVVGLAVVGLAVVGLLLVA